MAEVPPQQRPQPRNYRQRRDVFNDLSDAELIRRYRLDREGILFVTNLVRAALESDTMRNNPLTPELKGLKRLKEEMAALRTPMLAGVMARLGRLSVCCPAPRTPAPRPTPLTCAFNHARLAPCCPTLHTSSSQRGLKEFFDDEKHWGDFEVKVGRAWKIDELRIKSNEDLHKLWYVLLKEKNMLLTMEHACEEDYQLFPSPERIDKVEESMKHLEAVVEERNRAYWLLETGKDGSRPQAMVTDELGRREVKEFTEHAEPNYLNPKFRRERDVADIRKFTLLMKEKQYLEKRKVRIRMRGHVCMLLRRFPHMDMDVLQQKYPDVNVRSLRRQKRSLGHHLYNQIKLWGAREGWEVSCQDVYTCFTV
ncbi:39S ribosomal protein L47, mitochondrial [Chionoecetes opilio]|uniref:Large ribosomal subunit protein uL29m n=1 Tax=Chionoecetes opilio TaxID=41210 RepID=A0A8J8WD95_CHIOP|nr:39S ribosomal protein L47, mitochondrial [Chionoecetes opilio]